MNLINHLLPSEIHLFRYRTFGTGFLQAEWLTVTMHRRELTPLTLARENQHQKHSRYPLIATYFLSQKLNDIRQMKAIAGNCKVWMWHD